MSGAIFRWTHPTLVVKATDQIVERVALEIQRDAKAYAPVETGNLRGSITADRDRADTATCRWLVGTNVTYAAFVEFGTRYSPVPPGHVRRTGQRPFMGAALAKARAKYG